MLHCTPLLRPALLGLFEATVGLYALLRGDEERACASVPLCFYVISHQHDSQNKHNTYSSY
eukprot:1477993-Amphidinium_carterae.1